MTSMRRYLVLGLLPFMVVPARMASADPLVSRAMATPQSVAQTHKNSVGVLAIPKLNVTARAYIGVTLKVFDKGVGIWPGSPSFGAKGNIVIGGHRTSGIRPFFNIDKLLPGDVINLTSRGHTSQYVVQKTFVVKPTATWILNPSSDAELTLFSCHPKGSTSRRFVVRATLVQ